MRLFQSSICSLSSRHASCTVYTDVHIST